MLYKMKNKPLFICWILMCSILTLDLITTVIGLSLGAKEINPFAQNLFSFGNWGYFLTLIIYSLLFLSTLYLAGRLYEKTSYLCGIKGNKITMYCLICTGYLLIDGITILNNLGIIFYIF